MQFNYQHAKFVVVASVIDVRHVTVADPPFPDFKMKLERATFRVERVFKGSLKPGDSFVIDSGRTSCSRGVLGQDWMPSAPSGAAPRQPAYPARWMIYYTPTPAIPGSPMQPPPFEITASPLSRPVELADYDLAILEKLARPTRKP